MNLRSTARRHTGTSRRAILSTLLASVARLYGNPRSKAHIFNVIGTNAALCFFDRQTNKATKIGYVVTCPQDCGSGAYGTAEWIKEITYVESKGDRDDARKWLKSHTDHPTQNATGTSGCGHISKNVPVYSLTKDGSGTWHDPKYSNRTDEFYCLVAHGKPGTSGYEASEIWISDQDWDSGLPELQDACHRKLPHSECSSCVKCPPCT
jgi:hypothetical protein